MAISMPKGAWRSRCWLMTPTAIWRMSLSPASGVRTTSRLVAVGLLALRPPVRRRVALRRCWLVTGVLSPRWARHRPLLRRGGCSWRATGCEVASERRMEKYVVQQVMNYFLVRTGVVVGLLALRLLPGTAGVV